MGSPSTNPTSAGTISSLHVFCLSRAYTTATGMFSKDILYGNYVQHIGTCFFKKHRDAQRDRQPNMVQPWQKAAVTTHPPSGTHSRIKTRKQDPNPRTPSGPGGTRRQRHSTEEYTKRILYPPHADRNHMYVTVRSSVGEGEIQDSHGHGSFKRTVRHEILTHELSRSFGLLLPYIFFLLG